jgi:hypothetical protein
LNLSLNGNDNDTTVERTSTTNITAQLLGIEGEIQLLEKGTVIGSNTTNFSVFRQYNETGLFNITVVYNETQNYTSNSETHILTVNDTTPPIINISSPANNSVVNYSYHIQLSFSTDETANCSYSIDSGNYTQLGIETSFSTTFSMYENKQYNINVNCTDSYSNNAISTINFTVNDTTQPDITSTSPSNTITDTTPMLKAYTDEPAICAYSESNWGFENMTNFTSTNDTTSTKILSLSEGSYIYYARCKDRLNNTMNFSESISFTITSGSSNSGGGSSGCSDECDSGDVKCWDAFSIAICQYNTWEGCWEWGKMECGREEECQNGICEEAECVEDWICNVWSECREGVQTRDCADMNFCGTTAQKPAIEKDCVSAAKRGEEETSAEEALPAKEMAAEIRAGAEAIEKPVSRYELKKIMPIIVLFSLIVFFTIIFIIIEKAGAEGHKEDKSHLFKKADEKEEDSDKENI